MIEQEIPLSKVLHEIDNSFFGVQSNCAYESILRKRADRRRGFLAFEEGSLRFSQKEVSLAKSRE